MIVTYVKGKNGSPDRYVDSSNRIVKVSEYGKDFVNCKHNFVDVGKYGLTQGPNGKMVDAVALQCSKCNIYHVVEKEIY